MQYRLSLNNILGDVVKTVLITGGSRGIGSAMVKLFSERGYRVAFTYNKSKMEAEELSLSTGALAIKADSKDENDVKLAVETVVKTFGFLDILINNAAVSSFSLFTDLTLDAWREIFSVNVDGAFLFSREALVHMIREHKGRIINISSMWGQVGSSCEVHYSATKAAIIGMTKALAKEVGPSGITVNCISPGVIDTQMNSAISGDDMESLISETPLMRIGKPIDVAEAALFLAGDGAEFITGAVVNVNGGFIM